MRIMTLAGWSTVLVIGIALVSGCKKETPQKTEAPPPAPVQKATPPPTEQAKSGEALFKQHCTVCHPDGGNIVKPEHSLHVKALAAHNITSPTDIVKIMRNPGPGMNRFDTATISEKDAVSIAEYVLDTFK